jgi:hypothetical protein
MLILGWALLVIGSPPRSRLPGRFRIISLIIGAVLLIPGIGGTPGWRPLAPLVAQARHPQSR